jgi:hypothetical protein
MFTGKEDMEATALREQGWSISAAIVRPSELVDFGRAELRAYSSFAAIDRWAP